MPAYEANWIDFTVMGSSYEVQLDPLTSRQRHRPLRPHRLFKNWLFSDDDEDYYIEEWTYGPPPDRLSGLLREQKTG